jgi:hypothetical protein
MPESYEHIAIVKRVLAYIHSEYAGVSTLRARTDLPGGTSPTRPPIIGGYIPDVFCTDTPATLNVIGEAKTSKDLQTHRSLEQIAAFYDHLAHAHGGHLAVGVPWADEAFVVNFLKRLRSKAPDKTVKTSIVTELRVLQCF